MANLLVCINAKVRRGGWPMPIKEGAVYTEVDRYQHCSRGYAFVRIAEHEVPCPKKRYICRCGQKSDIRMAGMFAAYRFRPFVPDAQLDVLEDIKQPYKPTIKEREKEHG